ncbi:MAG TPA: hypothetical protein VF193_11055 [Steroidobacter sp.]
MIPSDIQIKPLLHYAAGSATEEWLREQIAMETEGATTPAQRTYHGEPLVNLAGVVLTTPERARELLEDAA